MLMSSSHWVSECHAWWYKCLCTNWPKLALTMNVSIFQRGSVPTKHVFEHVASLRQTLLEKQQQKEKLRRVLWTFSWVSLWTHWFSKTIKRETQEHSKIALLQRGSKINEIWALATKDTNLKVNLSTQTSALEPWNCWEPQGKGTPRGLSVRGGSKMVLRGHVLLQALYN